MLKSFLGVSASLASTIYVASFQPDGLGFLLFVAFLPVAIGLATVPFMNYVPYVEQHEVEQGRKHMSTGTWHHCELLGTAHVCYCLTWNGLNTTMHHAQGAGSLQPTLSSS